MQQTTLEPRPFYGIGTVARLTGLKPDTLRVWERRYGLGASHKSTTGRRQYSQADLEHLQLVSALVNSGTRIGEIAASERKTLEMLLQGQGRAGRMAVPKGKPCVVFVGEQLCGWLDEHQGCLANVDARLARLPFAELDVSALAELDRMDMLVVECTTLSAAHVRELQRITGQLDVRRVLVTYHSGNERWLGELEQQGMLATPFPPDPPYLAFEISRSFADKASAEGENDIGELVAGKPRQFSEEQLTAASRLQSTLDCECPRHISDLIRALANFEEYSSSCSVENWHEAAVHSCIYVYTSQARWLMEKSLQAVLEERREEFTASLEDEAAAAVDMT